MNNNHYSVDVPKLRFPEFRDASGWTFKRLSQLAEFIKERVGTTECTPYTVSTGLGLVSQRQKLGRTIAGNSLKNYVVLKRDDFAYNKSATKAYPQGFISRYVGSERAGVPNSIFTCFRIHDWVIDPTYLDYLFSANLHGRWLKNYITIGARAHGSLNVNDNDLMTLPVPLPDGPKSLREQQKISECLSSLDDVIDTQIRKLEAIKLYKQGLVQRLFPWQDKESPSIRFPKFRNHSEWRLRELGPMTLKVGSGITPTGGSENYKSQGRPFVRSQNVGWGELLLNEVAFIDEDTHLSFASTEVKGGDVLLNITGASIGRSAVADQRIVGGNVNQHVCIIRLRSNELNPDLLNQYLISNHGQKQIDNMQAGGNRQGLNFVQIRSLKIPLPPTECEQHQIAECLSSIDSQIVAESEKLTVLKIHKKGLMQQLFPQQEAN